MHAHTIPRFGFDPSASAVPAQHHAAPIPYSEQAYAFSYGDDQQQLQNFGNSANPPDSDDGTGEMTAQTLADQLPFSPIRSPLPFPEESEMNLHDDAPEPPFADGDAQMQPESVPHDALAYQYGNHSFGAVPSPGDDGFQQSLSVHSVPSSVKLEPQTSDPAPVSASSRSVPAASAASKSRAEKAHSRKRPRVARGAACEPCRRFRVKCDGKRPCASCIKANRAEQCVSQVALIGTLPPKIVATAVASAPVPSAIAVPRAEADMLLGIKTFIVNIPWMIKTFESASYLPSAVPQLQHELLYVFVDPHRRAMFYPLISAASPLRRLVPPSFFDFQMPQPQPAAASGPDSASSVPAPAQTQAQTQTQELGLAPLVTPVDKAQPVLVLPGNDPVFDFVVESDGDDENPTGVLSLRFRPIMTQSTSSSPTSSSPPSPEQRHLHELHAITHALSAPGALTQFQTQFAAAIGPAISPSMASAQTHVTQTFLSAPQPRALAEPDFYSAVLGSQWLSDLSRALSPCLEDEAAKATSVSLSPSTSSSPAGEAKASSPASLSPSSLAVSPVSVASFSSASSGSSPAQESKQSPQLETKFQPLSPSSRERITVVVRVNKEFERLFGFTAAEYQQRFNVAGLGALCMSTTLEGNQAIFRRLISSYLGLTRDYRIVVPMINKWGYTAQWLVCGRMNFSTAAHTMVFTPMPSSADDV